MREEEALQHEEEEEISSTDGAIVDEFKAWIDHSYMDQVSAVAFRENPVFLIDYNDIIRFNPHDLTRHFINDVGSAIESLKEALSEKMLDVDLMHENLSNKPENIGIRIQNYDDPISLREITTSHNKKMIVVNCIIAKSSEEKPFMTRSAYRCKECNHQEISRKNRYIKKCPACESEGMMMLSANDSLFQSFRNIVIQELPEDLPAGQIPVSKPVKVLGNDLTGIDVCRAGSRVKLTAIVKLDYDKNTLEDIKGNQDPLGILDESSTGTTFSLSLTANNIEPLGDKDDSKRSKLTREDIDRIAKLANLPVSELDALLLNSFAPHIHGHDPIKECLLLALVSSSSSSGTQGEAVKKRGDINILLVGNAGVAKSQMMLFAAKVSPRCIYVSGRGSSGVGLTAAVQKDEKTGAMMLEAGAAVLADQGVLVVDEFDKLRADDRSALHEVTEQQTCSVAKGGIVATLNARISLLAAANPKFGTYDSYKTLAENTEYPPSLLSRFDFIFVIKDVVDEEHDSNIVDAILGEHLEKPIPKLDVTSLAKYLQYVKSLPDPTLSKEAHSFIKSTYIGLRKKSQQDTDGTPTAITITARFVDTLKRATIARAKLLQKPQATAEDARRVVQLMSAMFMSFGINIPDPTIPDLKDNVKNIETFNLGLMYGKPASKLSKQKVFFETCDGMTNEGKIDEIDFDRLWFELVNTRKFVSRYDAEDFIRQMERKGVLEHRKGNIYRYNRDVINRHDT